MSDCGSPANVGSMEGLGPNTLAYARARVSLLGAEDHCATIEAALTALEGLPVAALVGGWTFKGFTAWAQRLETEVAMLKANIDSSPSADDWNALQAGIERLREALRTIDMEAGHLLGCPVTDIERGLVRLGYAARIALGPNV